MAGRPQDVRVWSIQDRRTSSRNNQGWIVRWVVDGKTFSRSFRTRALADRFRSRLLIAHDHGERFGADTGEPLDWAPSPGDVTTYEWTRRWAAEQWDEWQPRSRASALEALSRFVPLVARELAPDPPLGLRRYVARALDPSFVSAGVDPHAAWLARWSRPLAELTRENLAGVELALSRQLDGTPLSPSTAARYRKVSRACVRRAVDLEVLPADPWPPVSRGRGQRKAARVSRAFDVRQLPDPAIMRRAIGAIATHQPGSRTYQVMTAVAYYAGLRPSEVVMLRRSSLTLPETGWGRIDVTEADIDFDVPGEPKTGARAVPIPPVLVETLREWVAVRGGDDPSELLFRTRNGNRPAPSNWTRAWHRALRSIGQPTLRVYDCRHAAATTWLQAGVPLGEAARRLGHSVETLVSTYVGALTGDEELANTRIEQRLNA
jgi:integrase